LRESEAAAAPMLVTKALSQDVMVLAFVPLFADPRGVAQSPLQSTTFTQHVTLIYSENETSATLFFICAKAEQQQHCFICTKAERQH